jgi:glycine dehydrogenase
MLSRFARTQPKSAKTALARAFSILSHHDKFVPRHLGPSSNADVQAMLKTIGYTSLNQLIDDTVPAQIRSKQPLNLPASQGEKAELEALQAMMDKNVLHKTFIGAGYYDTVTPPVILRNIIENPAWYTPYTPYQAEIAQGRLEMLLNYQTMVSDLTGLPVSNCSLLDEATAAAEAMNMLWNGASKKKNTFLVSENAHPQTIAVIQTRAKYVGIKVIVQNEKDFDVKSGM